MITIVLAAFITVFSTGGVKEKCEKKFDIDISSIRSSNSASEIRV